MKPLVTVITITFNCIKAGRRESLIQCIDSVRNQNYENIEHIIVDGASTDGTLELLKEFPHLKVFSEPDSGVYNAFNKGVLKAQGKYVVFINSDDYFSSENSVKISVEKLEETGASYSYGDTWLLNEENPEKSEMRKPQLWKSFSKFPFCHQSMFCRTDALKEVGMFNENNKISSDYDVYLKLLLGGYRGIDVKSQIAVFRCGGVSEDRTVYIKEYGNVLKNNYEKFYKLSDDEAYDAVENYSLPLLLAVKLSKYLYGKDRWRFLLSQFRHFALQIRTSKNKRTLKIFGHYFLRPETD